ncbi:MAG TPA: DUF6614 family protein [Polyangiaceae bacterium]|jgi:hypothetical protein|nr:DUF6614 family protein [Polyangiaceae bacterium]
MDIYHIWCNLKPGVADLEFVRSARAYLDRLQQQGQLARYRITRCKLGLRPAVLPEFHLMLEFENLAQLDAAFSSVAARTDPVEQVHHAVNSLVQDLSFALYRDFPDSVRNTGQERF